LLAAPAGIIRRRQDLKRLAGLSEVTVALTPDEDLDRDAAFFDAVGRWAVAKAVTLLFAGSMLGHARAALERAGAVVIQADNGLGKDQQWKDWRLALTQAADHLLRVQMVPRRALPIQSLPAPVAPGSAFARLPYLQAEDARDVPVAPDQPGLLPLFSA
jgi:hypothetical protein